MCDVDCCVLRLSQGWRPVRLNASTVALVLQVAKLQMLSIGGVRMTPAAAHEQVTDYLARQGLKAQVGVARVRPGRASKAVWTKRRKSMVSSLMKHSIGYLAKQLL